MTINRKIAIVVDAVARHAGVSGEQLLDKDRHRTVAAARMVAMYCARVYLIPRPSFPELGRAFGNRDHTTIISAVRKVERLRGNDKWIESAVHVGRLASAHAEAEDEESVVASERALGIRKAALRGEALATGAAE
jgi:hypothetical protein